MGIRPSLSGLLSGLGEVTASPCWVHGQCSLKGQFPKVSLPTWSGDLPPTRQGLVPITPLGGIPCALCRGTPDFSHFLNPPLPWGQDTASSWVLVSILMGRERRGRGGVLPLRSEWGQEESGLGEGEAPGERGLPRQQLPSPISAFSPSFRVSETTSQPSAYRWGN